MSAPGTLLCVHPHPDDETIACGGILARASSRGQRSVVVTCTGGEEGENLAGIDLGTDDLVTHRRRELADALATLGVREHVWLGYRDSGMAGTPGNDHPDSFHRADLDEAAARLAAVIRRVRPEAVVSDDAQGTYGHPDHIKAYAVTVRAVELAADPGAELDGEPWRVPRRYVHTLSKGRLLASHRAIVAAGLPSPFGEDEVVGPDDLPFGTPDEQVTTRVDVGPWFAVKRRALAAHRSQIGPDSFFLNTPDELAVRFFGVEEFVLEDGRPLPGAGGLEEDLVATVSAVVPERIDGQPTAADDVTPGRFRDVLGRFATGVTIMTARTADGQPHAMTASAIASVSLDPLLVLACVDRAAVMADEVVAAGAFALSVLAADQAALSDRFADPDRPLGAAQFDGVAVTPGRSGAPLLDDAHAHVDCRVWAVHDGGDHVIVVGEVIGLREGVDEPLVHHRGVYGRFVPGRD